MLHNTTPFQIEPLPWRLPFLGDLDLLQTNQRTLAITPVLSWVMVMNPSDPVELIDMHTLMPVCTVRVHWLKKMLVSDFDVSLLRFWRKDVHDIEQMLGILRQAYHNELNTGSVIIKIGLYLPSVVNF